MTSEANEIRNEFQRMQHQARVDFLAPSLDWMCEKVIDTEEERDQMLNLLGRVSLLATRVIEGEASSTEEVFLRELLNEAFEEMGRVIERKQVEKNNVQMSKLNNPTIAAALNNCDGVYEG